MSQWKERFLGLDELPAELTSLEMECCRSLKTDQQIEDLLAEN